MEQQPQQLDIRRYIRLLYRKRYLVIVTALAIVTLAVVIGSFMPPVYEAKTVVLIQRNFINQLVKDITVTPSTEERIRVLALVMKSRALLFKVVGELGLDARAKGPEDVEKLVTSLQNRTEIDVGINKANRRDMDAFTVSFRDRDPKRAMDYVNTLVNRYIEENATSKREEASGASRFLTGQINFFKNKIDTVEAQIADLRGVQGATLRSRQAALTKRLEELSTQYTEQHPEVVKVKGEIEALQEQIRKGAGAARRPDRAASDGMAQTEGGGSKKFTDLERERDAYKKIYEELVATLGKSEVSTHVEARDEAGTFRVVDPAILPAKPVGPDRMKIMMLGVVGGIAGAFGLALFLDSQDDAVRTVDALKALGVPVLAVIPKIQSTREISVRRRTDALVYGLSSVYLLAIMTLFALKAPG
jgi:uncharacterized protein involved in exopolysaccharide biosynthesis